MAGVAPIRILLVFLLASCAAPAQEADKKNALPDSPSPASPVIQRLTPAQIFRGAVQDVRQPVSAQLPAKDPALRFAEPSNLNVPADFFTRHLSTAPQHSNFTDRASEGKSLVGRASYAASSLVITHDEDGKKRLNSNYLLRALTTAMAHSAYRPNENVLYGNLYEKRSASQPFGEFGSTIGTDAGMKVFHEFKPGILQLVKGHGPKFASRIVQHIGHN